MKKISKKRCVEISKTLRTQIFKAKTVRRLKTLHSRFNCINKIYNIRNNTNPNWTEYKPVGPAIILKQVSFYKDQQDIRQYKIMGHRSFCCPVTGEILDMDDSFILKNEIISANGLNKLVEKHGFDLIASVNT